MPYLGPPIAPRRIASADAAAESAVSVRGVPWASMEQPPRRWGAKENCRWGFRVERVVRVLMASAVTWGWVERGG